MSHYHHLTIESNKRACAFVLQITDPGETLKKLAMFLQDRHIVIDNMQLHRYRDGGAMLIIHCQVEKDRIGRTVQLLGELPGVMELETLK